MIRHKNDANRPACRPDTGHWRDFKYASKNSEVTCEKCIEVWNKALPGDRRFKKIEPPPKPQETKERENGKRKQSSAGFRNIKGSNGL